MAQNKKDNKKDDKPSPTPQQRKDDKPTAVFQNILNNPPKKEEPKKETFKLGGETIKNDFGNKLNQKELENLQKKTGLTPQSIIEKVTDRLDIKIAPGSKTYATSWQPPGSGINLPPPDDKDKTINDLTQKVTDLTDKVTSFTNLGTLTESVETIGADADRDVAQAYADAQKYGYDKEAGWRTDVANIEVKGKLDLQPIINAGLERVADIEGQSARDVAKTTGEYSLKSMETRTEADKALGKMQLAGSMYGLLSSAFG